MGQAYTVDGRRRSPLPCARMTTRDDTPGWADVRLTDAASIERWWEVTLWAYLWLSLRALVIVLRAAGAAPHRWGSAPPADAAASPMD